MSDSPIVLTLTIYPPKKNQRRVVVTGAPEGEMPLLLAGLFAQRHALLDQAFTAVLKRAPQVVTTKESRRKQTSGVQFGPGGTVADDADAESEAAVDTDESATDASGKFSNAAAADDLPAIEGDTVTAADGEPAASVNDDDSPDEEQANG